MIRTLSKWAVRLLLAVIGFVLLYQLWIFIHIWWWRDHNPSDSAFMSARLDVLQEKRPDAKLRHQWTSYGQISIHLKRAVIAAEDAKFVDHEGFDWEGIQRAIEKNEKKGKIVAGGSTISQQLAKNLFLSSKRTPWRKIEEAVITIMLEQMMSKRRILEIYLNVIEWGESVFGCDAAARHYYGVPVANLSPDQAAKLAAMVPNPRFYDRNRYARGLQRKTGIILVRMNSAQVP
ncbi:MAG: monofunctional biosynthetic peptidoglycan transglycosylase [Pseudomonadota bacterium]